MDTPQNSEDTLQDRLAHLNLIVNRRNEFLRELFCLLKSREDINTTSIDDEDEGLGMFLKRFDLGKGPERGSIFNLTDDEISFPSRGASPHSKGLSSTDVDGGHSQATSTRTTRSRARADEVLHLLPLEKSKAFSSEKTSGTHHTYSRSPMRDNKSENMAIDTDEDNDELDLIGSSTFSDEGERESRQEASRVIRRSGLPGAKVEASMSVDKHPLSTSEASKKTVATQDDVGVAPKRLSRTIEMDAGDQNDLSKRQELIRDKDDAMDDEEVEAITKPSDPEVAEHSLTVEDKMDVSEVSTAAVVSDSVPSQQALASPLPPFVASPSQTIVSIRQASPVPSPDGKLPQPSVSEVEAVVLKTDPNPSTDNYRFNPSYTIPPLSILPADFTRKAKSIKRKKDRDRDKERERERDSKRDKEDNVPMGLSRWAATLMANPLWRKVSRASKTLSTHDWSVAMTELRLIRTIERIELLKNDGRWSFRQPKKQRGIGGSVKSHWDYLLDEMKWMRIDFREERRWKLALAYNLSTAVLEWHYAKTPEERQKAGIVVKWKRPRVHLEDDNSDSAVDMPLDVDRVLKPGPLLGLDYDTEEEEEEEEGNQGETMDPLEPSAAILDALDSAQEIQPKDEEMEDQSALQLLRIPENATIQPEIDNKPDDDLNQLLKSTSENPLLSGSKSSSQSVNGDGDPAPVSAKPSKSSLAPLRQKIVHSDDLFFDLSDISASLMAQTQDTQPQHLDLHTLFHDLQPFGLLDVSPSPVITQVETKKKSEKKSDRDDPTKRAEDLNYAKLFPTGRFMHTKPTLIGPLQPAKRFKDDTWLPIDPQAVTPDMDGNTRLSEDTSNDLFEGRPSNASSNLALQFHSSSLKGNDHLWTASDDAILKQLVDRYSTNWALVTECYNSSRFTTPTERRTPADCAERWKERWSAERKLQLSEPALPVGADGSVAGMSTQSQMTTRAVKRLASASVSGGQGANVAGEKKRRRHYLLQESIKRAAKKRADAIKTMANQRKPPAIHETHTQYNRLPLLTPLELARMKADKDQRESHDIQLARRRQEEAMRQNLLREQAQRGGIPHNSQVPQPQNQPQAQSSQTPQPQVQQGQTQQAQQALAQQQQQQLAQLQQLQAQQHANQSGSRANLPAVALPNRQTRLATPNGRPINPQAQAQAQAHLLQQVRAMQVPMQLPPTAQANLAQVLSQAQAAGNSATHLAGNPYYSLPSNLGSLTQEQILNAFALQTGQHSQQQQSSQSS